MAKEIQGDGKRNTRGWTKEIKGDGHKSGWGWTREIQGAKPNTRKFSLSEAG